LITKVQCPFYRIPSDLVGVFEMRIPLGVLLFIGDNKNRPVNLAGFRFSDPLINLRRGGEKGLYLVIDNFHQNILFLPSAVVYNFSMNIIPQPKKYTPQQGHFLFSPSVIISAPHQIRTLIEEDFPELLSFKPHWGQEGTLQFALDPSMGEGEHGINISTTEILVTATDSQALLRGYHALLQLLLAKYDYYQATGEVPCGVLSDYPTFAWRGMHLDSARHMQEPGWIKGFIRNLALYQYNLFHWHLTDDQGWRIPIDAYPELTKFGGFRKETRLGHQLNSLHQFDGKPYGGFYSKETIREIVHYAQSRGIQVMPEIDMPGHMQAAIAAYPHWGSGTDTVEVKTDWGISKEILIPNEEVITAMKTILDEVMDLFPGPWIHLGGDEAEKDHWKENDEVQKILKKRGLAGEEELEGWFIGQVAQHLQDKGRKLVAWDEILEGDPPSDCQIMSWRSDKGAAKALKLGLPTVICDQRFYYFDHYQSSSKTDPLAIGWGTTTKGVYTHEPLTDLEGDQTLIQGLQGQIWTEYLKTESSIERMVFPRILALAERAWNGNPRRSWEEFSRILEAQGVILDRLGVNHYRGSWE